MASSMVGVVGGRKIFPGQTNMHVGRGTVIMLWFSHQRAPITEVLHDGLGTFPDTECPQDLTPKPSRSPLLRLADALP